MKLKKICDYLQNNSHQEPSFDLKKVRETEKQITKKATELSTNVIEQHEKNLENSEKHFEEKLESFLILLTRHRRYKDVDKGIKLWARFKNEFVGDSEHQKLSSFLSQHMYSILLKDKGSKEGLDTSIRQARRCLKIIPDYPGALHNLAGGLAIRASLNDQPTEKNKKLLTEALDLVNSAIDNEPEYPKYYATRARIFSQLGAYERASHDINYAINQEDSDSSDYSIRLADYLGIKSEIALFKATIDMKKHIEDATISAMNEAKRANIQILTIFIAVISFLIGGISISTSYSFTNAAQLIFILGAALLLSLSGFGILYEKRINIGRLILAFSISTASIVIAFCIGIFFWDKP